MSSSDTSFDWIAVDRARAKVQPSEVPEGARVLELPIPASYRAFLRAHGYGLFGGLLHFFPWAPGYGDDLCLRAGELRAMLRHTLDLGIAELDPDGSAEALSTLVPFGISINGDTLCWSTTHTIDGEPEVVVVAPKVLAFHRTAMSFGAFVRSLVEPTLTTRLYCFDADGELDDDGDRLRDVTELGLRTLLTIGNLEDVIVVRERRAPDSTLEDYVRAVDHYREYDAFEP